MIKEITQKYENVQKGVGDIMGGVLIETNARKLDCRRCRIWILSGQDKIR